MNIIQSKKVCRNYLAARKKFLQFANKSELLHGNDNIIGSRIGEFIAWEFLNKHKRKPMINKQPTVADYDIICKDGAKISVKLISPENKTGRITRLGHNWDELILILLDANYKVFQIGQITKKQFIKAIKNKVRSKTPYVSRSMMGTNGLIGIYGIIYHGKQVKYLI